MALGLGESKKNPLHLFSEKGAASSSVKPVATASTEQFTANENPNDKNVPKRHNL